MAWISSASGSLRKMAFPPPRPPLQIPGLPPLPPMLPPPYAIPGMGMIPMTMGMMAGHLMAPLTMTVAPPPLPLPTPPKPLIKKPILTQKRHVQDKKGPPVTVFVGNITERATDSMIRQILQRCGTVINWKRVQGANGRLQAFGFCEYADPESGLRAIRLLHEWEIGDKKLVVKVDAKTKEKLDEYKASKTSEEESDSWEEDSIVRSAIQYLLREHGTELTRNHDPKDKNNKVNRSQDALLRLGQDGEKNDLDEMDLEDEKKSLIHREIDKFRDTYKRAEEEKEKERRDRRDVRPNRSGSAERRPESPSGSARPSTPSSVASSESSKRTTDQRRGRDTDTNRLDRDGSRTERERAERERERQERDRVDRERDRDRDRERERDRERDRDRDRERERERERDREKERSRMQSEQEERSERAERRSRSRSPRERDGSEWKESSRDSRARSWEREEEEENYERKKLERKLRDKETAYKERLRNWEVRERRKIKEYEKEKVKELEKKHEEMKEARRLKEFLEDYDDDRDDPKYYKGSALARRLKEREKEAETDNRDRHKEREELEELRRKLAEEGHPDPAAEAKRLQEEEEWKFKVSSASSVLRGEDQRFKNMSRHLPSMADEEDDEPPRKNSVEEIPVPLGGTPLSPSTSPYQSSSGPRPSRHKASSSSDEDDDDSRSGNENLFRKDRNSVSGQYKSPSEERSEAAKRREQERLTPAGDDSTQNSLTSGFSDVVSSVTPREEAKPMGFPGLKFGGNTNITMGGSPLGPAKSPNVSSGGTANQQHQGSKRKKMTVEEAFNTQEDDGPDGIKKRRLIPLNDSSDGVVSNEDSNGGAKGNSLQNLSTDEKRQHIKNLIDKIPTTKDELFAYSIDWSLVDSSLMERRIRPWINKKIVEYIGEEEATLVEFICSKVMVGSSAKSILEDVYMVLDEEAEVFVVKMWRLLIYEIEAKKLGIMKV